MSKLTVTTVDTGSVTTNLTLTTANTLGSSIVVSATDGTIDLRGNVVNTGRFSGNVILSGAITATSIDVINISGNLTGNVVATNITASGNLTANVIDAAVKNMYFGPIMTVGANPTALIAPSLGTTSSTAYLSADRQCFLPVYISSVFTTTTLACKVTTAVASSSIRMNLYAANSTTGSPTGTPLSSDVLVSSATTGVKTGSYVTTLKPGLYWASILCSASSVAITGTTSIVITGDVNAGSQLFSYIYGTYAFGAMGNYSSVTSITGQFPATNLGSAGISPVIFIY